MNDSRIADTRSRESNVPEFSQSIQMAKTGVSNQCTSQP